MSTNITPVQEENSLEDTALHLASLQIAKLAVVKDGKVTGIVSQSRIFSTFTALCARAFSAAPKDEPACNISKEPPSKLSGPERRFFKRVSFQIPAAYRLISPGEGKGRLGQTINASAGGLLLRVPEAFPMNGMVDIALDFFSNNDPVKSTCRVVRCEPSMGIPGSYDVGLMFLTITVAERKRMMEYLDTVCNANEPKK